MRISFQIFLSLDPMARQAYDGRSRVRQIHESRLSPLEEAIVRGHMEVWTILKEQTEMTVELKLEQLHNMMVSAEYQNRGKPHTEFKELLSSLPLESV